MKKSNKTLEEHIEEILKYFNWGKVEAIMQYLNWTWYASTKCPTVIEMKDAAIALCTHAYNQGNEDKEFSSVASGGFIATYYPDTNHLTLSFAIETWDSTNIV